jgi:nucleotide-binding universal stress UspA family protein
MISHYKLIIVPVDGSEGSARAAAFAADLARATESPVELLHVYAPVGNEAVGMAQLPKERIEEMVQQRAASAFASARAAMNTDAITIEQKVAWGDPREEIVYEADKDDAIIIIGRRGLGKVKELLIGSVSDAVLRTARRPVVIVG